MKISDSSGVNPLERVYKTHEVYERSRQEQKQNTAARSDKGNSDKLELSQEARELREIFREAGAPEVREKLVGEIRERIQNGTYEIPESRVADKISEEIMNTREGRGEGRNE